MHSHLISSWNSSVGVAEGTRHELLSIAEVNHLHLYLVLLEIFSNPKLRPCHRLEFFRTGPWHQFPKNEALGCTVEHGDISDDPRNASLSG